jgi:hypothetical protein
MFPYFCRPYLPGDGREAAAELLVPTRGRRGGQGAARSSGRGRRRGVTGNLIWGSKRRHNLWREVVDL